MTTPDRETRRALARLHRALEKARREVRGLRKLMDASEAEGFPGDDCDQMDEHLAATIALVRQEQARQQAKILRAGGITSRAAARGLRVRDSGAIRDAGAIRDPGTIRNPGAIRGPGTDWDGTSPTSADDNE